MRLLNPSFFGLDKIVRGLGGRLSGAVFMAYD